MTLASQTALQIQSSITKTYKNIAITLIGDQTSAGIAVKLAINTYIELSTPTSANLTTLEEALYTYQNQLVNKVGLHQAIEELLLSVKSFVTENEVGYTPLDSGLATEYINNANVITVKSAIGNVPIGPKPDTYLNKCTVVGDVFTVGGSIFQNFDLTNAGPLLSNMTGLNSITGHDAALAQCGSWSYNNIELYASTTYTAGTVGDNIATGCSSLLSKGDVASLCQSVFDVS